MENEEKLQKVTSDTSDEVQNSSESNETEKNVQVDQDLSTDQNSHESTDEQHEEEPVGRGNVVGELTATDFKEEVAEESDSIKQDLEVSNSIEEETELTQQGVSTSEEKELVSPNGESNATPEVTDSTVSEGSASEQKNDEASTKVDDPKPSIAAAEEEKEEAENEADAVDNEDEVEEEVYDFENADKKELLSKLKECKNEENYKKLDAILKAVKPRFDELFEFSKNEALQKFVSEGNEADAFEFHGDEYDKEFIALHGQLRAKRNKHFKDLNDQREDNLKKKESLLENLRQVVDGEESINSIESVKEIQAEWKKIGPVPGVQNTNLWANYNALLDRYYDNRSIYFELKDLDRKKNFGLKQSLCEKAEALAELEDLKVAIVQLNDLHEEYKHIGPVPKEDQEPLWQRFKKASDQIYSRRKEYFDGLKVEFEANLVKKDALIKEVESFVAFTSDRITEWNDKTKALLEVQKKWEAIGGVPREKAKSTNRAFWNSFKKFFSNKNQFFKQLEGKREENLARKEMLITSAEGLKDSDQWDATAQKFKNLQAEWKEIGPVPEKVRKETYARFKEACDHFFNRRRDQNKEKFKEYDENLLLKQKICDQLEVLAESSEVNLDEAYDLIDNYTAIGFVPKNAIKKIARRFEEAVDKLLSSKALDDGDAADLKNHFEVGRLRNTPGGNRKIQRKENSVRRKISTLENDISTWNTNMGFFANSANAEKLKAEMQQKVEAAEKELAELKSQLRSMQ